MGERPETEGETTGMEKDVDEATDGVVDSFDLVVFGGLVGRGGAEKNAP